MISAKVIADSVSTVDQRSWWDRLCRREPVVPRVTTVEVTMHRFVLAELNTHRVMSRNSASSRAIPLRKQLARVKDNPAFPYVWASEQPGMQGGTELEGTPLGLAHGLFYDVKRDTVARIEAYLDDVSDIYGEDAKAQTLHKSLVNRLLEPFMWHVVALTATDWENFFNQRCSPLAQPEFRIVAEQIRAVIERSTPVPLEPGEWHTPYADDIDGTVDERKQVSAGRCARTSYLTHDGERDPSEDITLFHKLATADPMHASPMEHQCTPVKRREKRLGNLRGFRQFRHEVEADQ